MPDQSLPVTDILMGLLGGLALFLFGMEQMTDGLKAVAGDGMRKLLQKLTTNRVAGALTGAIVTAVIQSSSVTTVLVVGFVSAGLMNLTQCVGVIMGANVGTTITAQIVAFKVTKYALALVFVGFAMIFAGKREKVRKWGEMVMGLGLIFFGMGLMSDGTAPLRDYEPFIELMQRMDNPFLGILVAAAFTALVQSSSATTGIVIVLATQGFISLEAGIALAFGANVGTCVTALLATLGKPRTAMQAATVHVLFNVAGVLIWLPFIDVLGELVRSISPAHPELADMQRLAAETPRQIANAHTVFNIANTALLLPIAGVFAAIANKLVPVKAAVVPERAKPRYLDASFIETPALAVDPIRKELARLGRHVTEFAADITNAAQSGGEVEEYGEAHDNIQSLYQSIVAYIMQVSTADIGDDVARSLRRLGAVAVDIEHVAEIFATNIVALVREQRERQIPPDAASSEHLADLHAMVRDAFVGALAALESRSVDDARAIIELKPRVQAVAEGCAQQLARRIVPTDPKSLQAYRVRAQVVELLKRQYYFAKKICKEVVAEAQPVDRAQRDDVSVDADVRETLGG